MPLPRIQKTPNRKTCSDVLWQVTHDAAGYTARIS